MSIAHRRFACFSLVGGFGTGVCALIVLLMVQESLASTFSLKFLSSCVVVGLFLGAVAPLYVHCAHQDHLKGIGNAILFALIPLIFAALRIDTLANSRSADDRSYAILVMACSLAWWLVALFAGIAEWRGARWGSVIQSLLVAAPISVMLAASLYSIAVQPPEPGSLWSHWHGTRLVGTVILVPICTLGLFFSLFARELVIVLGLFAAALMSGAGLGGWIMGPFGWPVTGAFVGGIVSVGALARVVVKAMRAKYGWQMTRHGRVGK